MGMTMKGRRPPPGSRLWRVHATDGTGDTIPGQAPPRPPEDGSRAALPCAARRRDSRGSSVAGTVAGVDPRPSGEADSGRGAGCGGRCPPCASRAHLPASPRMYRRDVRSAPPTGSGAGRPPRWRPDDLRHRAVERLQRSGTLHTSFQGDDGRAAGGVSEAGNALSPPASSWFRS